MKILQVTHGFPPYQTGGTENCTYLLSKELKEKHNEKVFVFSGGLSRDCSSSFKDEGIDGIEVRRVHSFPFSILRQRIPEVGISTYRNAIIENIFMDYLEKTKPNVVHFQHTIGLSSSLINVAIKYHLRPIVTIRDFWYICPRIQMLKFNKSICAGPDCGFNCAYCTDAYRDERGRGIATSKLRKNVLKLTPERIKNYLKTKRAERSYYESIRTAGKLLPFIMRYNYVTSALKTGHTIVAPSHYMKMMYVRTAAIEPRRIVVIPHGIIYFDPGKRKGVETPLRFGFCGPPSVHKGAHLLLEAFKRIPKEKARLIIWGKGWDKHSKALFNLPNIEIKGAYYPDDLGSVYASFDVLIIPSIWGETFSFVAHEAFLAKTPLIASRYGVFKEIIKDGENGLLFDVNDAGSLCSKLVAVIEKPKLIETFSVNIKAPKTWGQYSEELLQVYREASKKEERK
jgi:glycosyltransferase involved in cell wall biosynthesis